MSITDINSFCFLIALFWILPCSTNDDHHLGVISNEASSEYPASSNVSFAKATIVGSQILEICSNERF